MASYTGFDDIPRERTTKDVMKPVIVSTFEEQSEQRRLITDRVLIRWKITTPHMSRTDYADLETFYLTTQDGALESGNFTDPYTDDVYVVRFAADNAFRPTLKEGLVQVEITLETANQDEV